MPSVGARGPRARRPLPVSTVMPAARSSAAFRPGRGVAGGRGLGREGEMEWVRTPCDPSDSGTPGQRGPWCKPRRKHAQGNG